MKTYAKPMLVAAALALAGSGTAWAQSGSGYGTANRASDNALSVNGSTTYTTTYPGADTGTVLTPTAPVRTAYGEPIRTGTSELVAASSHMQLADNDAQQRAARAARATDEEEHGGTRNRLLNRNDTDAEEHGGLRNRLHEDDAAADDHATRRVMRSDDTAEDARERAARRDHDGEEHGGFWNRLRNFFHHD